MLDRAFCNLEWDLMLLGFGLQALSSAISDHCPIIMCQQLRPRKKEVFHVENFWVKVPEFREVVQEAWDKSMPVISPLNILHYKLKNAARNLKSWSNKVCQRDYSAFGLGTGQSSVVARGA
jgi:hypothetical protein